MRLGRNAKRRRRPQAGVALIELAIAMPFLATFSLGVVDLARGYQLEIKLRNAAREAAGFAQYYPNNATSACSGSGSSGYAVQKAINADSSITIAAANVSVVDKNGNAVTCSTTFAAGDTVKVTVTGSFNILTPLVSLVTGSKSYTVTGSNTVVVQTP